MTAFGTVGGTLGGIASGNPIGGLLSGAAGTASDFVLQGISSWVLDGTRTAIEEVASAIGDATAPNLNSTWFSSTYWRVAALAAMLTIPFLCAAAVQAVGRGDLGLLVRSAFGYLPLSLLGVSLAAPLTMLLLAATDQMSAAVSASAATGGAHFLDHAAEVAGTLATAAGGSPFFAVVVGLLAVMAAMALAVELLVRAAAVYVVVLMLPLAFAALVWPARRVWAARLVELLASLILSKFVIVAVLSLAGAAFASGTPGIGQLLVAMSLILLSTCAPWALMRILPFTELAAGAAGILGGEMPYSHARAATSGRVSAGANEMASNLPARLRDQARTMHAATRAEPEPGPGGSDLASSDLTAPAGHDVPPNAADDLSQNMSSVAAPSPSASPESQTAGTATAAANVEEAPFVLPDAWRGSEEVRLDDQLLRHQSEQAPPPDHEDKTPPDHADKSPRDHEDGP